MKQQIQFRGLLHKTVLLISLAIMCAFKPASVMAGENLENIKFSKSFRSVKLSKSVKVRGFQLARGVYFGHAKVGGQYGLGFVVDRKSYFWGINNRGFSISKRF